MLPVFMASAASIVGLELVVALIAATGGASFGLWWIRAAASVSVPVAARTET